MDFTIEDQGNEKRVMLSGTFTFGDNQKFKQMMGMLGEKKIKAVMLNFAGVEFIDSGALGMLLLFRDECQTKNIPVCIQAARGQVQKIFMISKLDQLFSMREEK